MQHLLSRAARIYRGALNKPKTFVPDADRDVFLVTYPRSGTTWASCIAASLIFGVSPESLRDIDNMVPDIHALPESSRVPAADNYLVKSHLPLSGVPPYGDYRRVVYLIRDPRDVLLSYHRFALAQHDYRGDLVAFAADSACGRIWPCSWQEHVASWLGPRKTPQSFELTVLRYEDFVAEPVETSVKLAKALGLEASRSRIEEVVADATPDAMRRREAKGRSHAKPGLKFIGPATAGGWKDRLLGEDVEALRIVEDYAGHVMKKFGYVPHFDAAG